MPNLHWKKYIYPIYEQGPSGALDLHDLWDGDQCEAAKLQLGTTSPDQLAEDQLRLQPDDEFPQGLRCGGQTWLCWEETSATNWCGREGGLQPGAEARLFPVYLSGTYQILASYLLGAYQVLMRYLLGTYQVLMEYLPIILIRLLPKEKLVKLLLPGLSPTAKHTLAGTNTSTGFPSGSESISMAGDQNIYQRTFSSNQRQDRMRVHKNMKMWQM